MATLLESVSRRGDVDATAAQELGRLRERAQKVEEEQEAEQEETEQEAAATA